MAADSEVWKQLQTNPPGTRSKVHIISDHTILIHGNCEDIIPLLPHNSIKLLLTDPPYGNSYVTGHRTVINKELSSVLTNNALIPDLSFLFRLLPNFLRSDGAAYIFGDFAMTAALRRILGSSQLKLGDYPLVWVKNNWTAGNLAGYANRVEYITYLYRRFHKLNGQRDHNVLAFPRVAGNKMLHPTEKPLGLLSYLIIKSTEPGDIILDPFAGSSSTALASALLGRRCIAIEYDEKYIDAGLKRLRQQVIPTPDPGIVQPQLTSLALI